MQRIVQLSQGEYESLCETATLNKAQIEQKAQALWKQKGVAEVNISVKIKEDYTENYKIQCDGYIFYKDDRFFIPQEFRNRIMNIVEKETLRSVEMRYGKPVELINHIRVKADRLNHARYALYAVAASGWASLISYWCLS